MTLVKVNSPAIKKANAEMQKEMNKQIELIYGAACIALYEYYGFRKKRLDIIIQEICESWYDCSVNGDLSMIKMLDDETGIEIQNGTGQSYKDLAYLSGDDDYWINKKMSIAELIYMKKRQITWIRPQIVAALLLGMHRKFGFGFDRCNSLLNLINYITAYYHENPHHVTQRCVDLTGINILQRLSKKRF